MQKRLGKTTDRISPATFRDQLYRFAGPREYISGALSREDLGPLREAGCGVSVVAAAGHVLMWDNLPGFTAAVAEALRARSGGQAAAARPQR